MKIGIDFGTTNSAVAVLREGKPEILEIVPGERTQRTVIHASNDGTISFGNEAFQRYLDQDLSGRFLRSLKAFLPQDVPSTRLGNRNYTFPELISAYVRFLVSSAERALDEPVTEVVVGRPVSFHAEADKHDLALERLSKALREAGLPSFTFQLEPVAAAHLYEIGLSRERTVLVGDFGGGTSDFAVFLAGPERKRSSDRTRDVLGTSGVASAGDALDGRFMDTFLSPSFGRGLLWNNPDTERVETWEHPIVRQIQRLYSLHLLRTPELERGLAWLEPKVLDPVPIRRIKRLVFDDLGYPMAWAIERSKRMLSVEPVASFRFEEFYSRALDLSLNVDAARFAEGSADLLAKYRASIDEVLACAQLREGDIDDVFLTGGTSQLPFIRALFAERFGDAKIRSADAFTSVCEGLALS